jgi:hypothetical protein
MASWPLRDGQLHYSFDIAGMNTCGSCSCVSLQHHKGGDEQSAAIPCNGIFCENEDGRYRSSVIAAIVKAFDNESASGVQNFGGTNI